MTWKEKRPNILILMTDQQRCDTINAVGYSHMQTPNLDRLAAEGCLFTNAYSPIPICIPARHNLITGLPPRYHGFADNDFEQVIPYALPTLPRILSDHGYETRAIGKMQHCQGADIQQAAEKVFLAAGNQFQIRDCTGPIQ